MNRTEKYIVEAARQALARILWAERRQNLNLPDPVCDALQTLRECCEDHSKIRVRP